MALTERREHQLLRIPPVAVAVERPIARTGDLVQLARGADDVLPTVGTVRGGALAPIPLPFEADRVTVFAEHRHPFAERADERRAEVDSAPEGPRRGPDAALGWADHD
ncbi:hypothetical protein GCM10025870_06610 [Agromyces marinus]|uniref:Uncharacterized protein n=1 Tax=Agromyces marinus TaxID=1389020 RepID=A0ABM8GYN0_9MICO|nr:hypothetical protein GCM10025870_06610 [Agromyces marinus]